MNLENNLHSKLEFSTRRKRGLVQTKYVCMSYGFLEDDEGLPRLGGSISRFEYPKDDIFDGPWKSPKPWKSPEPWKLEDSSIFKAVEMSKKPVETIPELKFINETLRLDSHPPWGDHFNYEVSMKKIGSKYGRTLNLLNLHILLGDNEDE